MAVDGGSFSPMLLVRCLAVQADLASHEVNMTSFAEFTTGGWFVGALSCSVGPMLVLEWPERIDTDLDCKKKYEVPLYYTRGKQLICTVRKLSGTAPRFGTFYFTPFFAAASTRYFVDSDAQGLSRVFARTHLVSIVCVHWHRCV